MAAGRGRSRRVSIPGVAELLRPVAPEPAVAGEREATGREKHDHKITVYLSAGELLDLEHARLVLRRLGVVVDRGRLVREAIAVLLADLDARGKDSLLARRMGIGAPAKAGPEPGTSGEPGAHSEPGRHSEPGPDVAVGLDAVIGPGTGAGPGRGGSAGVPRQAGLPGITDGPEGALPSLAWRR